jgi:hypothetical protein
VKNYAVAYMNFFSNDLTIKFVESDSWKNALYKAFPLEGYELPDDMEEARVEAFNGDWMFFVKEFPGTPQLK